MRYNRSVFLLLLMILSAIQLDAQDQVWFKNSSLQSALNKAKKENKLVFVDTYTTWCGPCKWMDKNVFNDPKIARLYNDRFINLKLDMEEKHGLEFAKRYKVTGYPTFYFIQWDGKLLHYSFGARGAEEMLTFALEALNSDMHITKYEEEYRSGERSADFLRSYAQRLENSGLPERNRIFDEYLATQSNWLIAENMQMIFDFSGYDIESIHYKYIAENIDSFYTVVGAKKVDDKLKNGISASLGPMASIDEIEFAMHKAFPNKAVQYFDDYKLHKYLQNENEENNEEILDFYIYYHNLYKPDDWIVLNNMAWNIMVLSEDSAQLSAAVGIAQRSIDLHPAFHNYDSLAAIHFKLGNKHEALESAKVAIDLGLKAGENVSGTSKLINQIKKLP